MSKLNEVLSDVKEEAYKEVVKEYRKLMKEAKSESKIIIRENAKKLEKWLGMLVKGELDQAEFDALLRARKRTIRQYLNTLEIKKKKDAQRLTLNIIKIAVEKVVPIILAAI
jgi:DNA topoisomerase VI subunit B